MREVLQRMAVWSVNMKFVSYFYPDEKCWLHCLTYLVLYMIAKWQTEETYMINWRVFMKQQEGCVSLSMHLENLVKSFQSSLFRCVQTWQRRRWQMNKLHLCINLLWGMQALQALFFIWMKRRIISEVIVLYSFCVCMVGINQVMFMCLLHREVSRWLCNWSWSWHDCWFLCLIITLIFIIEMNTSVLILSRIHPVYTNNKTMSDWPMAPIFIDRREGICFYTLFIISLT